MTSSSSKAFVFPHTYNTMYISRAQAITTQTSFKQSIAISSTSHNTRRAELANTVRSN